MCQAAVSQEEDVALSHACFTWMYSICEQPWGHTLHPVAGREPLTPYYHVSEGGWCSGLFSRVLMSFINYVGRKCAAREEPT